MLNVFQDGVAVEFLAIDQIPNPPKITNVITQTHPGENMVKCTLTKQVGKRNEKQKSLVKHFIAT